MKRSDSASKEEFPSPSPLCNNYNSNRESTEMLSTVPALATRGKEGQPKQVRQFLGNLRLRPGGARGRLARFIARSARSKRMLCGRRVCVNETTLSRFRRAWSPCLAFQTSTPPPRPAARAIGVAANHRGPSPGLSPQRGGERGAAAALQRMRPKCHRKGGREGASVRALSPPLCKERSAERLRSA